jgi:phospholipid/cholesterol/gamma-HCH transport system substrate-binding protein
MNGNNNRRAIIVSIFALVGLAILVVTIFTLGGQKKTFKNTITVKAIFDDVNGLQKGNNIWFSGVKVGTIRKVFIRGNAQVEVDMGIDEASTQFIRRDAKAKVSTDGLIGNKIIVITGGSSSAPQVEAGDFLGIEKQVSPEQMLGTLSQSNKNLLEVTGNFKLISENMLQGKGTAGKLLSNDELINQLTAAANNIHAASAGFRQLASGLNTYVAKMNTKGSPANELVSDTVIFARLRSTVQHFEEASQQSKAVVKKLDSAASTVNHSVNSSNNPVGLLLHDSAAAKNLSVILQNLNSGTKKLDEDLEALQHNFLFRGFFKRKAKEKEKVGK